MPLKKQPLTKEELLTRIPPEDVIKSVMALADWSRSDKQAVKALYYQI
jgi:hypothetical protein